MSGRAGEGGVKLTPMLSQYLRLKERHRDAILMFRLGDFYEMFFEDAERAAGILDITLYRDDFSTIQMNDYSIVSAQ